MIVTREERRRFLDERRNRSSDPSSPEYGGVGGSQIADLMGYGYGDALSVYHELTRPPREEELDPPKVEEGGGVNGSHHLVRGIFLEDDVVDLWRLRNPDRELRNEVALRRHPEYPFAIVHADRMILAGDDDRGTGALEAKAPGVEMFDRIRRVGVKPAYLLQLQWTLFVRRWAWGEIAVGNFDDADLLLTYPFDRREKIIRKAYETAERFFEAHVLPRRPPTDRDAFFDEANLVPAEIEEVRAEVATSRPEEVEAIRRLFRAKRIRKRAEAAEEEAVAEAARLFEAKGAKRIEARPEGGDPIGYALRVAFSRRGFLDGDQIVAHRPIDRDALLRRIRNAEEYPVLADVADALDRMVESGELDLDVERFRKPSSRVVQIRAYPVDG